MVDRSTDSDHDRNRCYTVHVSKVAYLKFFHSSSRSYLTRVSDTLRCEWAGPDDFPDNNNNKGAQRTLVVGVPLRDHHSTNYGLTRRCIVCDFSMLHSRCHKT